MTRVAEGFIDGEGRLVRADPALARLQEAAGGAIGQVIAVPQIATLVRLAQRLGVLVSRCVIAADGADDLDLWVQAKPEGGGVALSVGGWARRPGRSGDDGFGRRVYDFVRSRGDWLWETDPALKLTSVTDPAGEAMIGAPLTRLFHFIPGADGDLPILEAIAARARFEGQEAEVRGSGQRVRLTGLPLIDGGGRFAGYRGSAFLVDAPAAAEPARPAPVADEVPEPETRDPGEPVTADGNPFGTRLDTALRQPLARIVERAESIGAQSGGPIRRDYADYATDIAGAGRHLLALVDDLVDLQAVERHDFQPLADLIDLADLSRRAASLLGIQAGDRGVRIDPPAMDESLPARGDYRRTLQILVNLIGNAVRHSPEGGMVWVRAEREGARAIIVVADQGHGIDPAEHERIFEKFTRIAPSDPGGSGLGLYIARRLARAMGGDLTVDSALGQGARFVLALPSGG
ncbi:PAS domain-containing sensor histidine kinase [Sphingomonas changnyeongensis]|uniref:histidine kinase n=1 Tax=Sphingomonas changnyeongensis TaxID=2698679 RepID=A0A7Z2S5M8_9SPHN|nr:HAMP domain-containing sensor histidine kinase [Sphingomonas changnyeongensis]QHL91305.1 PAS domain-containing sensor histidine kinase [Sphingomonas changnyeongensis]